MHIDSKGVETLVNTFLDKDQLDLFDYLSYLPLKMEAKQNGVFKEFYPNPRLEFEEPLLDEISSQLIDECINKDYLKIFL